MRRLLREREERRVDAHDAGGRRLVVLVGLRMRRACTAPAAYAEGARLRAYNRGSSARSRTRQPSPKHCAAPSRATSCRPTCSAAPVRRHRVERLLPPALIMRVLRVSAAECRGNAHNDLDLTGDNVEEFAGNKAFLYERDSGRDAFFHERLRHRPHLSPREALKECNLQRPAGMQNFLSRAKLPLP